jgi:hypothetical protein
MMMTGKRILTYRTTVLRLNAAFLVLFGFGSIVLDVAGALFKVGPAGAMEGGWPAMGAPMIEAHFMAGLFGLFFWHAARTLDAKWHGIAALVHLCMGIVNLVFWQQVFVQFDQMVPAYVTTGAHWFFVVTEGTAFWLATRSRSLARAAA